MEISFLHDSLTPGGALCLFSAIDLLHKLAKIWREKFQNKFDYAHYQNLPIRIESFAPRYNIDAYTPDGWKKKPPPEWVAIQWFELTKQPLSDWINAPQIEKTVPYLSKFRFHAEFSP